MRSLRGSWIRFRMGKRTEDGVRAEQLAVRDLTARARSPPTERNVNGARSVPVFVLRRSRARRSDQSRRVLAGARASLFNAHHVQAAPSEPVDARGSEPVPRSPCSSAASRASDFFRASSTVEVQRLHWGARTLIDAYRRHPRQRPGAIPSPGRFFFDPNGLQIFHRVPFLHADPVHGARECATCGRASRAILVRRAIARGPRARPTARHGRFAEKALTPRRPSARGVARDATRDATRSAPDSSVRGVKPIDDSLAARRQGCGAAR